MKVAIYTMLRDAPIIIDCDTARIEERHTCPVLALRGKESLNSLLAEFPVKDNFIGYEILQQRGIISVPELKNPTL